MERGIQSARIFLTRSSGKNSALQFALRPAFREVTELLGKMDRLVLRFRKTEPGARFAARIIRDRGQAGPGTDEDLTPPAP